MNFKGDLCVNQDLLSFITLYPLQQFWKFYIFVISNNQSFISQILRVVGPLGEKCEFFSPLGFKLQSNFDLETTKIKLHLVRALKRYLNEKNLLRGRETATI